MKSALRIMLMLLFSFSTFNVVFAETDVEGGKDHPLFNRMPNFYIEEYQSSDFDSHEFNVATKDSRNPLSIEGKKTYISYRIKEGAKYPSSLQIVRNFQNAAQNIGFKLLYENTDPGNRTLTLKLNKGSKETWVEVDAGGSGEADWYTLTIVEKGELAQDITANYMLNALNKEGHIALYINFDTGKSIIKPESQSIIDRIVQMMKQNPGLKIGIEGHTDNVGNSKLNKTLSEERAKSVVSAIVKQGVDAKRLSATGFGQDKPIADNKTEEGRAKNRRVELVKR